MKSNYAVIETSLTLVCVSLDSWNGPLLPHTGRSVSTQSFWTRVSEVKIDRDGNPGLCLVDAGNWVDSRSEAWSPILENGESLLKET